MTITFRSVALRHDNAAPAHAHDCESCHYLGSIMVGQPNGQHDVYLCPTDQQDRDGSLILRYASAGPEYKSFPVGIARIVAQAGGPDEGWAQAVQLLDLWEQHGRPEFNILALGEGFFDHFTVACSGALESSEDGETGTRFTVVGLGRLVNSLEHINHYLSVRHPQTHCQHAHDCCGNTYSGPARWSYVPGTGERAIVVHQRWHVNV